MHVSHAIDCPIQNLGALATHKSDTDNVQIFSEIIEQNTDPEQQPYVNENNTISIQHQTQQESHLCEIENNSQTLQENLLCPSNSQLNIHPTQVNTLYDIPFIPFVDPNETCCIMPPRRIDNIMQCSMPVLPNPSHTIDSPTTLAPPSTHSGNSTTAQPALHDLRSSILTNESQTETRDEDEDLRELNVLPMHIDNQTQIQDAKTVLSQPIFNKSVHSMPQKNVLNYKSTIHANITITHPKTDSTAHLSHALNPIKQISSALHQQHESFSTHHFEHSADCIQGSSHISKEPIVNTIALNQALAPANQSIAKQVLFYIERNMGNTKNDHIEIQLNPASLGQITVKMEMEKGNVLHMHFISSQQETVNILSEQSNQLSEMLSNMGLDAETMNMNFTFNQGQEDHSTMQELSAKQAVLNDMAPDNVLETIIDPTKLIDKRV